MQIAVEFFSNYADDGIRNTESIERLQQAAGLR
jgi:hypothetical protein